MANSSNSAVALRGLGSAAYFVAFLLVAISLFDYSATVWPFRITDVSWRFGAVGLLSGFLLTPLLGVLVAMGMAALQGHAAALKTFAIVSVVVGIAGSLVLIGFALDAIQMYQAAAPDIKSLTEASTVKASVKLVTGAVAFIWLGIGGLRPAR